MKIHGNSFLDSLKIFHRDSQSHSDTLQNKQSRRFEWFEKPQWLESRPAKVRALPWQSVASDQTEDEVWTDPVVNTAMSFFIWGGDLDRYQSLLIELTPEKLQEIYEAVRQYVSRQIKNLEKEFVSAVADPSWVNTMQPLSDLVLVIRNFESLCRAIENFHELPFYSSEDEDAHKNAEAVVVEQKAFASELFKTVFQNKVFYQTVSDVDVKDLGRDQQWLVEVYKERFVSSGVLLTPEQQARLTEIDRELERAYAEYKNNFFKAMTTTTIDVETRFLKDESEADLKKLDLTSQEIAEKDVVTVKVNSSTYGVLLKNNYAQVRHHACSAYLGYATSGDANNIPVVLEELALRAEVAEIYGEENYVDLVLNEHTLFSSAEEADQRITEKVQSYAVSAENEWREREALARQQQYQPMDLADNVYYSKQLEERGSPATTKPKLDVREYLPSDVVMEKTFEIYEEIFSIHFESRAADSKMGKGVQVVAVFDQKSEQFLGEFLLYPYSKARGRTAPIQYGFTDASGGVQQQTLSALFLRWPKPNEEGYSNLDQKDLEIFFHELGHIVHNTLGIQPVQELTGIFVNSEIGDVAEVASQSMGRLVRIPEVLQRVSYSKESDESLTLQQAQSLMSDYDKRELPLSSFNIWRFYLMDTRFHSQAAKGMMHNDLSRIHEQSYDGFEFLYNPEYIYLGWYSSIFSKKHYAGKHYQYATSDFFGEWRLQTFEGNYRSGGDAYRKDCERLRESFAYGSSLPPQVWLNDYVGEDARQLFVNNIGAEE